MKIAPVYHSLLKNLKLACRHKPHYVQDIRFILSLPLVTVYSFSSDDSFSSSGFQGCSDEVCDQKARDPNQSPAGISHDIGTSAVFSWGAPRRSSSYLERTTSECWALDPEMLYDICRADLRAALDGSREASHPVYEKVESLVATKTNDTDQSAVDALPPKILSAEAAREYLRQQQCPVVPHSDPCESPPSVPTNLNPVALRVLRYRELLWLKSRLEEVLGADADRRLAEVLRVSAPLSDEDFIPDAALCSTGSRPQKDASRQAQVSRDCDNPSSQQTLNRDTKGSTSVCSDSPQDETSSNAIISAGAVGIIRECAAFRHKENFPMATAFLEDCDRIDVSALRAAQYNTAELTRLVCDRITCSCSSQNEDLQLSAWGSPFDPEYVNRAHAGKGYFGQAHLIFSVRFQLEPLDHSAHIQLVNSYFTCLNIRTNSMMELTGYLHPRDVMALLQERDLGKFTFQSSVAEVEHSHIEASGKVASHRDKKNSKDVKDGRLIRERIKASSSAGTGGTLNTPAEEEGIKKKGNAQEFELVFVNDDEGPVCIKGIFYYKVGTRDTLAFEPIKAITFGHILLNS
ncbi:unnamed protein product [Phytomonas sp. EM1]|nr:unnamed protein product [Phytomonas sp. EM1]|eukprot:CCW62115.1 unnamed protein product [Phytomonas sp. isolate EM1]